MRKAVALVTAVSVITGSALAQGALDASVARAAKELDLQSAQHESSDGQTMTRVGIALLAVGSGLLTAAQPDNPCPPRLLTLCRRESSHPRLALSGLVSMSAGLGLVTAGLLQARGRGSVAVAVDPGRLDFGHARVGASVHRGLTIANRADAPIQIIGLGVDDPCFAIDAASGVPIEVRGRSKTHIDVQFRPIVPGTCSSAVVLETDNASRRFLRVALRGRGTP